MGFSYRYSIQIQKYNGDWSKRAWEDVPISNFCTPRCNDVARLNDWNGGVYLPFSQTFFNDDDAFEYVRFKAEVAEGERAISAVCQMGRNHLKNIFWHYRY